MIKVITNYIIVLFIAIYSVFFTFLAFYRENVEFIYYNLLITITITISLALIAKLNIEFSLISLLLIFTLVILHFLGGNISINETRLYDFYLIKDQLKYDNIIHFLIGITFSNVAYNLFSNSLSEKLKNNILIFSIVIMLIGLGLSAIIEIIELGGVVFFNTGQEVGDYLNNAYDLYFNFLGAAISGIILSFYYKHSNIDTYTKTF